MKQWLKNFVCSSGIVLTAQFCINIKIMTFLDAVCMLALLLCNIYMSCFVSASANHLKWLRCWIYFDVLILLVSSQHAQPDPIEIQRQQENRRRAIARKRAKDQLRPRSPDPVEGRKHIDVQTELYLEELSDRVEEADVECQTDAFLDRPPSPLFIQAKTGVDIATQIIEGDVSAVLMFPSYLLFGGRTEWED